MLDHNKKYPKRRDHYYSDGVVEFKKPLPSVTHILKLFDKPFLTTWLQRQAVEVALGNPSLSVKDILSQTAIVTRSGATRGTGIHNLFPDILEGRMVVYPDVYIPYVQGIEKFVIDFNPKIILKDKIIKSLKYGYAGSLDCVLEINGKKVLVDLKTGNTYPEHRLQLAAYKQALSEDGIEVDSTAILLLKGDGVYQYILTNEPFQNFLNVKTVWEWWKGNNES